MSEVQEPPPLPPVPCSECGGRWYHYVSCGIGRTKGSIPILNEEDDRPPPDEENWADDFEWITRHCKCGVHLEVNGHRDVYQSVEEELANFTADGDEAPDDVTAEMIRQDRIVRVQAYPDTPIGHYVVLHHDIGAAVKRMREILEGAEDAEG